MARGDIAEICVPPRGTAVLARAKTGMMKKVERGESLQPYVLEAATVGRYSRRAASRLRGARAASSSMCGCSLV